MNRASKEPGCGTWMDAAGCWPPPIMPSDGNPRLNMSGAVRPGYGVKRRERSFRRRAIGPDGARSGTVRETLASDGRRSPPPEWCRRPVLSVEKLARSADPQSSSSSPPFGGRRRLKHQISARRTDRGAAVWWFGGRFLLLSFIYFPACATANDSSNARGGPRGFRSLTKTNNRANAGLRPLTRIVELTTSRLRVTFGHNNSAVIAYRPG